MPRQEKSDAYDSVNFDLNFRENPSEYVIGRGEFGVLMVQPYKSEILPHWKYKNESVAVESAEKIESMFHEYLNEDDLPGADMARKYLQMGFTRAMRYAKYPGGKKYNEDGSEKTAHGPDTTGEWYDEDKRKAAVVFRKAWERVRENGKYLSLKEQHRSGSLYKQSSLTQF